MRRFDHLRSGHRTRLGHPAYHAGRVSITRLSLEFIAWPIGIWLSLSDPAAAAALKRSESLRCFLAGSRFTFHPPRALIVQMSISAVCVSAYFLVAYGFAKRYVAPLMRIFRKIDPNEAVTSCVLSLFFIYAISAEWLGSVAGITGAYSWVMSMQDQN